MNTLEATVTDIVARFCLCHPVPVEGFLIRRPDLPEHHESLDGGWVVATNLNDALKKTIIQLACDVAGMTFGKDVVVQF